TWAGPWVSRPAPPLAGPFRPPVGQPANAPRQTPRSGLARWDTFRGAVETTSTWHGHPTPVVPEVPHGPRGPIAAVGEGERAVAYPTAPPMTRPIRYVPAAAPIPTATISRPLLRNGCSEESARKSPARKSATAVTTTEAMMAASVPRIR